MKVMREPMALLAAFERASDAVFAVDQALRVVYWNAAAERVFGLDREDALGRCCDAIMGGFETSGPILCTPECRVILCARRGQPVETYDLVRTDDAGRKQWLNVSIVVLRGRRRTEHLAVHLVRDVTDRRHLERQAEAILAALPAGDRASSPPPITAREAEVLRLLACGCSNAQIAETLQISATTARNHIEHLLAKLEVHSKLEAVVYAARHHLL